MEKILIINTGGTFNKRYNPLKGSLDVPADTNALENILNYFHNTQYELISVIHKDSLEMTDEDRDELVAVIKKAKQSKVLIIHGTDTKDLTAEYLEKHISDKTIVFTGAMVPFSIDTTEATANFSLALGFLLGNDTKDIFIAMHGAVEPHHKIYKNRQKGIFEIKS